MKPLEIQRYNLIYRERFTKKFYYNLNEQKLILRGQLLKIYYVNIGLNHMLFTMRNLRGLLNCLLHYCRNILMSLLSCCMCLADLVKIYRIVIDLCYLEYYLFSLFGISKSLYTLLPYIDTLESFTTFE